MPRQQEIGFSAVSMGFAIGASLLTGILAGLLPCWQLSSGDVNENLKEGGRSATQGAGRLRTHGVLVAAEVALAVVLLVGAGLMIRTLLQLQSVDPGFQPKNLLTMTVTGTAKDRPEQREVVFQQVRQELASMPEVASVSAINHLPIGGDVWTLNYSIPGRAKAAAGERPGAVYRVVRTAYFETMGLRIMRGRDFTEHDNAGAPAVAIVNQTMARRQWPEGDPIGRRVVFADEQTRTIIGVAQDARQSDWTSPPQNEIYLPYAQRASAFGANELTFVIRTRSDPGAMAATARQRIWNVDPDLPVSHLQSMEQVIGDRLWRSRLSTLLLGIFGAIALTLAAVGIYGVIAYSVGRRTREVGIRMALGAKPADVLWLALSEGMRPVLAGTACGLVLAAWMTRWIGGLLYGVKATDALTFAAVTVLLACIAGLANYIPAWRATRVDPLVALRQD